MMERNAQILRNKVEVLERRKSELLRQLTESEAHLAELSAEYDARLASRPLGGPTPTPSRAKEERRRRERASDYRMAFIAGLGLSLFFGLLVVFGGRST